MTAQPAPLPASPTASGLATLLHLGRRARQAEDLATVCFVAVNETHALAPYRQAALWLDGRGVAALSGVVSVEGNTPYVQWLSGVFRHLAATADIRSAIPAPRILRPDDLREADRAEWAQWLPSAGLWLPIPPAPGGRFGGGALLLAREQPWTAAEITLLEEWAAMWSACCALHTRPGLRRLWQRGATATGPAPARHAWLRRPRTWVAAAALALAVVPVRLTVLAPAELIPLAPSIIRAPLDGVIDTITVEPNQRVEAETPLFTFDRTTLRNRLAVAERELETTRAEYRQRAQMALSDERERGMLAVLQGRIAEKTIEVDFLRDLDARSIVLSPRAGVVLFDDPTEWIGRPVVTGERVMVVADESAVEVEAWLAPSNAIALGDGAPVTLYLNADPLRPLIARLRYLAHEAIERPDGTYAYRVRATLEDGATASAQARTGLKGTAKLEGERVPLVYWVLRRPLADARAWLGI